MSTGRHILIADDHDLFRRGLCLALTDGLGEVRVSEAGNVAEAMAILAAEDGIALASFDLRMPGMNDGAAIAEIRRQYPALPIAVLSAYDDRQTILRALQFGASGFIPKGLPAEQIVTAMQEIMDGRIFVPPSITAVGPTAPSVPSSGATLPPPPGAGFHPAALTPRQRAVFDLLILGRSTKEIARTLGIAEGTVKIYVAAIFRALGARNRVEAVMRAAALGFGPTGSERQ